MHRVAYVALILLFWFMAGGLLLAGGESPWGVLLVLLGMTLPVVALNRAFDKARERRGRVPDFTMTLDDLANLSAPDVVAFVASLLVGISMLVVAFAVLDVGSA